MCILLYYLANKTMTMMMVSWLNLEIGHGDFVDVVVVGASHLCEQLGQGTRHDAGVVVSAKHRVRLPGT